MDYQNLSSTTNPATRFTVKVINAPFFSWSKTKIEEVLRSHGVKYEIQMEESGKITLKFWPKEGMSSDEIFDMGIKIGKYTK